MMATAKATNSMAGTMEPDDGFYNEAIDLDHAWMKHFIPGKVFDQTPNTNDQEGGSAGGHHEQIPKIESLDFHQSEQLMVSVTTDAAIRIYNTRLGQQVKSFFSTKYGASAVQFAHAVWRLHPYAMGKHVFGPRRTRKKPDVDLSVTGQPARSASA